MYPQILVKRQQRLPGYGEDADPEAWSFCCSGDRLSPLNPIITSSEALGIAAAAPFE